VLPLKDGGTFPLHTIAEAVEENHCVEFMLVPQIIIEHPLWALFEGWRKKPISQTIFLSYWSSALLFKCIFFKPEFGL
jgi:hypothetical protein